MAKEVKFSLVFRDMWQAAGNYVPRVDQLMKVAPVIVNMGCFDGKVSKVIEMDCFGSFI